MAGLLGFSINLKPLEPILENVAENKRRSQLRAVVIGVVLFAVFMFFKKRKG